MTLLSSLPAPPRTMLKIPAAEEEPCCWLLLGCCCVEGGCWGRSGGSCELLNDDDPFEEGLDVGKIGDDAGGILRGALGSMFLEAANSDICSEMTAAGGLLLGFTCKMDFINGWNLLNFTSLEGIL